jgi:hypothetical protein
MKVFSFCLFGNEDKYCKGLLKNIESIHSNFPGWYIWVYIGDGVPVHIIEALHFDPFVNIIETHELGLINTNYRFFAIDDPTVEIAIIRDADSRVYERDVACIQDFIASHALFHIIRDHPNHASHKIMAGMWGIKQGLLKFKLRDMFAGWKNTHSIGVFWDDTNFLQDIYSTVCHSLLVHDELHHLEPDSMKKPFRVPIHDKHFIGQVYNYDEQGQEYAKFYRSHASLTP